MSRANQFYDYNSITKSLNDVKFNDGQQGAFVKESLIKMSKTIHEYMPPSATYLQLGMTIDNTGGYYNQIKSLRITGEGEHEEIGTSGQGGGKISYIGEESFIDVKGYEGNSDYTVTELNQAKIEGINLYSRLVGIHNKKYQERIDKMGYATLFDVNNGFERKTSTTKWRDMDDEELSNTLRNLILQQRSDLNSGYHCNVLIVPSELKLRCDSADYKAESEMSISEKLKKTLGVSIIGTFRATKAGAVGTDLALALNTNPNAIAVRIPKRFSLSPTHRLGNRFYFESSFRFAGTDILEVSAGMILEGL